MKEAMGLKRIKDREVGLLKMHDGIMGLVVTQV
jgi:hypothetical protein